MKKRLFAGLLALCMTVNLMSATAFAEESVICAGSETKGECLAEEHVSGCSKYVVPCTKDTTCLAEKHDASLWDLFSVMGGLDSVKLWEEQGLAQKDKVHFTKKGYELVGNLFFDAFINAYSNKD